MNCLYHPLLQQHIRRQASTINQLFNMDQLLQQYWSNRTATINYSLMDRITDCCRNTPIIPPQPEINNFYY